MSTTIRTTWMIDRRIDLSAIGAEANWQIGGDGIVERLQQQGIDYEDAERFAVFICEQFCLQRDGYATGTRLSKYQQQRLTVAPRSLT